MNTIAKDKKHIVVVGGGAGGLELVAKLSKLIPKGTITLTLVDNHLKHVWKPLLHEVAAGTLPVFDDNSLDYLLYANEKGFQFQLGCISGLDRSKKSLTIAPYLDENDKELIPERTIHYDILVIAIGSLTNDFGIPGVREHCLFLDTLYQAEYFNTVFVKNIIKHINQVASAQPKFAITIIGAGATGVELAAELNEVLEKTSRFNLSAPPFEIVVIEAANRILPALPEKVSTIITQYLEKIGVKVLTHHTVSQVHADYVETTNQLKIPTNLCIWAAGVKADSVLAKLDGLEVNKINQLLVNQQLQTTKDNSIFAFGDCASCPQTDSEGKVITVPPRAQAAHQQANLLAKSLPLFLKGQPLLTYYYKDYGSLIALSNYNVVGHLMNRMSKNFYIDGKLARISYWSLHKNHLIALWGLWRVGLITFSNMLTGKIRARLKLH